MKLRKIKGYEDKILEMTDEEKKALKRYWTDVAKGLIIIEDEKEDKN
jgi:hypothetical protein